MAHRRFLKTSALIKIVGVSRTCALRRTHALALLEAFNTAHPFRVVPLVIRVRIPVDFDAASTIGSFGPALELPSPNTKASNKKQTQIQRRGIGESMALAFKRALAGGQAK